MQEIATNQQRGQFARGVRQGSVEGKDKLKPRTSRLLVLIKDPEKKPASRQAEAQKQRNEGLKKLADAPPYISDSTLLSPHVLCIGACFKLWQRITPDATSNATTISI